MHENKKTIIAATFLVLAAIALGVAVANAYYASTRPTNSYGTYSYNNPSAVPGPSTPYGQYGSGASYGNGYGSYGQWAGGMGGMDRMGGGMGMP